MRTVAEGWLDAFSKSKAARDAQGIKDGKNAAQFIQATGYNPVVAATAIKRDRGASLLERVLLIPEPG